jgi:hypothetical protein
MFLRKQGPEPPIPLENLIFDSIEIIIMKILKVQ